MKSAVFSRRGRRAAATVLLTGLLLVAGATAAEASVPPNPVTVKPIASSDGNAGTTGTLKWVNPGRYVITNFSISDFAPDGHGPELFIQSHKQFDDNISGWKTDYYYHYTDGSGRTTYIPDRTIDTGYSNTENPGLAIDFVRVKICNGGSQAGGGDHCSAWHQYSNRFSTYD